MGPVTIAAGGSYSGCWTSTDSTPAIRIATTDPVVITNSVVTNLSGGPLIVTNMPLAVNLTIRNVTGRGSGGGRFLDAEGSKSVTIENCDLQNTGGIKFASVNAAGASIVVRRNRARNITPHSSGSMRQFVQLAEVTSASVEIAWNEVINEYGKSQVEDVVSIFKSNNADVHDNYFKGGYPLVNGAGYSGAGLTIEQLSSNNHVHHNQFIDGQGIGIVGGHDNLMDYNTIVQDGKLDDGSTYLNANLGLGVINADNEPGWANNHAIHNTIGYINKAGSRNDMWFPDAPSSDYNLNTTLPNPITNTTEQNQWTTWLNKLAANGVQVGV